MMKQYRWSSGEKIEAREILCAITSQDDYSTNRIIILEANREIYVVLECSCRLGGGFSGYTWKATEFDGKDALIELKKFLLLNDDCKLRKEAYNLISWKNYIPEEE